MVWRSDGMLQLFTTHSRLISWESSLRKKIRHSIPLVNEYLLEQNFIIQFPQKKQEQACPIQLKRAQTYLLLDMP